MSDLQAGTRVFLTASGDRHHPPVGTAGTVTDVAEWGTDDYVVTVKWDTELALTTIVTKWNGKIARVWS